MRNKWVFAAVKGLLTALKQDIRAVYTLIWRPSGPYIYAQSGRHQFFLWGRWPVYIQTRFQAPVYIPAFTLNICITLDVNIRTVYTLIWREIGPFIYAQSSRHQFFLAREVTSKFRYQVTGISSRFTLARMYRTYVPFGAELEDRLYVNPFRAAVPLWGQTTWKLDWFVPKTGLRF